MQGIIERPGKALLNSRTIRRPESRPQRAAQPETPFRPAPRVEPVPAHHAGSRPSGDLFRADFSGEWLTGARFSGEDLRESSFRSADLTDADLRRADLRGADFAGADLTGADLRGADFRGARLTSVRFRGARCDAATRWPAGFQPEAQPGLVIARNPGRPRGEGQAAFWIIAVVALGADQFFKAMVRDYLAVGGSPRWLPGDVLFLQRVENHGLNFQLLEGAGPLLTVAMGLVLSAVFAAWTVFSRRGPVAPCILTGLALVFGGGLGNALDRLFFGAVLDYIGLPGGPVINFADLAVLAGLLCLGMTRSESPTRPATEAFSIRRPA